MQNDDDDGFHEKVDAGGYLSLRVTTPEKVFFFFFSFSQRES